MASVIVPALNEAANIEHVIALAAGSSYCDTEVEAVRRHAPPDREVKIRCMRPGPYARR